MKGKKFTRRSIFINIDRETMDYGTIARIWWGFYENAERRFVDRYILPNVDVVELGSSIGIVSSHIAAKLTTGRLICVEANRKLISIAQRNIRSNNEKLDYRIINKAINQEEEMVGFHVSDILTDSRVSERSENLVEGVLLSDLLRENDIGEYQLVSDVEGAEDIIMRVEPRVFLRCKLAIVEFHPNITGDKRVKEIKENILNMGLTEIDSRGHVSVFLRR